MNIEKPKKKTSALLTLLIVVILILVGIGVYVHFKHSTQTAMAQNTTPISDSSTLLPAPKTISPFSLTDDSGQKFNNDSLKAHWSLLFFGFSRCGDVCPTTLTELNKMMQQLQKDLPPESLPQVVMITVDPDRDTPNVMHKYVKSYNADFIGATGSVDMLNVFHNEMGMSFGKVPKDNNEYSMSHSSQLFLFNPDGNWVGIFTYPHHAEQMAKDYEAIINNAPQAQ